jgi:hypothetical protein
MSVSTAVNVSIRKCRTHEHVAVDAAQRVGDRDTSIKFFKWSCSLQSLEKSKMPKLIFRHVWVYTAHDPSGRPFLATLVSPDKNGVHLNTIATPYDYITSRGEVRYFICSENELTREKAIEVSQTLYEAEFSIENIRLRRNMRIANR